MTQHVRCVAPHISHYKPPIEALAAEASTFFFPLLALAAAMAFASLDFCSLGACSSNHSG